MLDLVGHNTLKSGPACVAGHRM